MFLAVVQSDDHTPRMAGNSNTRNAMDASSIRASTQRFHLAPNHAVTVMPTFELDATQLRRIHGLLIKRTPRAHPQYPNTQSQQEDVTADGIRDHDARMILEATHCSDEFLWEGCHDEKNGDAKEHV